MTQPKPQQANPLQAISGSATDHSPLQSDGRPPCLPFAFQRLLWCLAVVLAAWLGGCTPQSRFPLIKPARELSREEHARIRAQSYFVKALDYDRRGLGQMALRFYELAHDLDPSSMVLRNILVGKYAAAERYTQAALLIKKKRNISELPEDDRRLLARIYLRMGKLDQSAAILEKITEKTPDELYSLALVYESKGDVDKAIEYFRLFLEAKPNSLSVGLRAGELLIRHRRFSQAESLYVGLEEKFPQEPRIFNGLGLVELAQGDTASALNFFATSLLTDSLYEEGLRNAAQIHIRRGQYDKAVEFYRALYSIESYGAEIYGKTLALLEYYAEQYDTAAALLHSLLEESVNDQDLHFYLGMVAAAVDNDSLAILEFEKTLALESKYVDAWRHLSFLFLKKKQWDEALSVASRFTQRLDKHPAAWRTLGYVRNARKEYPEASEALRRALVLDSTDSHTWFELGSSLERQKDISGAAGAFRKVLELKPGDAAASNYLGYMWADEDMNLDTAKVLLETALGKEPDNGAYLDSYAWIFYKMGAFDSAHVYISKAIEVINDDAIIYDHLGDILTATRDFAKAVQAYEKSIELGIEESEKVKEKIEALQKKVGSAQ